MARTLRYSLGFLLLTAALLATPLGPVASASVTDTLSTVTLVATFDADTPDAAPDLTLPGPPAGDLLTIGEASGTVRVRSSVGTLTAKPVEMNQVPGIGSMSLHAFPVASPGCDQVTVRWRSLARSTGICFLACTMRGSGGAIAASLEYRPDGIFTYNSVPTIGPTLPVGYVADVDQQFTVTLDFTAQTSSLAIDGVPVTGFQNVPFPQPVASLGSVGFEAGCTSAQDFAVDEISAVAFCDVQDQPPALFVPGVVNGEEGGVIGFLVTASDPDGDPIDALLADLEGFPEDATFTPDEGNQSGSFLWHPGIGDAGSYEIVFTALNALTTTARTRITIGPVGTSVTGKVIWPTHLGDEGVYDVIFTAVNTATGEETTATTTITVTGLAGAATSPTGTGALSPQAPTKGPVISAPRGVSATVGDTVVVVVTAQDADETTPPIGLAAASGAPGPARAASLTTGAVLLSADLTNLPDGNEATFTTNNQPAVLAPATVGATAGSQVTIHISAADPDGNPILDLQADTLLLPTGNNAVFEAGPDNLTGTLTWTPAAGQTGSYDVTFFAINALVGKSTTTIVVTDALEARAFQAGHDKKIKLETLRPEACLQLEPVGGAFSLMDVDYESIVMISIGTGTVSQIPAIQMKQILITDKDENGVPDATVCFTKANLRSLFSQLRGHVGAGVAIEGLLADGRRFRAEITLDVYAGGPGLTASLSPNPLNPSAILTVWTNREGPLRVKLFDAGGRWIRTLTDGPSAAGAHAIPIDGRDRDGRPLATGIYFYRVEAAEGVTSGRFTILK